MEDRQSQDDASLAADAESVQESKSFIKYSVFEIEDDRVSKIIPQEDAPNNLRILATAMSWRAAEDTDQETQEEATPAVAHSDGVEDKVDKDVSVTASEEVKEQADDQSQEKEQPEEKDQSDEKEQSQAKEQSEEQSPEKEQLQVQEQLQEKEQSQINLEIEKRTVEQAKSSQDAFGFAEEATLPPDNAESRSAVSEQVTDIPEEQGPVKSSQIQLGTTPPAEEVTAIEETEEMTGEEKPASPPQEAPLDTEEHFRFSASEELLEENTQTAKDNMLWKLHSAMVKQDTLRGNSLGLQSKISEFYKKTKFEFKWDADKKPGANEETYLRTLAQLQKLRDTVQRDYKQRQSYISTVKLRCQQKQEEVEIERKKWSTLLHKVVYGALFSHTRKPIPPNDVEHYLKALSTKQDEISKIRLRLLKLKNKIEKNTMLLKSKEELAEGFHLQDFEQLKIENQTYNEKIEERNEDMLKLKKKISSTVQIMSHCKEKLNYVQHDNLVQVHNLKEVEASLVASRENLAKLKRVRDVLRTENAKLREECGLLGNKSLLSNYELKKETVADLTDKLQQAKNRYAILSSKCSSLQNKIEVSSNATTEK